jgi:EmrB/QacA subfamily drug resistance transporter
VITRRLAIIITGGAKMVYDNAQRRATLGALMVVFLLGALDQTIVSTAMPRIIAQLNGLQLYAWVTTAYMLASTVMVPIYGKLGDQLGRKPVLITGIVIFLLGSCLCGLAGEPFLGNLFGGGMLQLIVFRAIQGLGGAALFTSAFGIIADMYAPAERGKMGGFFGAVFGLSSVLGPIIGGFFTDHGTATILGHVVEGWRWVFYVNLPLGLLSLFMLIARMPNFEHVARGKVDLLGAALVIGSATPLLLALTWGGHDYAWTSGVILGLFATSAVCLAALIRVERGNPDAIIPLELFHNRVFRTANAAAFVLGMAFLGVVMFLPLFMQLVQGVSATKSGLSMLPLMAGLITASIVSGQLVSKTGRYKPFMIGGGLTLAVGVWLLSHINANTSTPDLAWRMFVVGLGLGPSQSLYNLAIQNAVEPQYLGVATSSSQFFRQIGSTIGVALFGTVLTHHLGTIQLGQLQAIAAQGPGAAAIKQAFSAAIANMFGTALWIVLLGALITLAIPALKLRERVPHSKLEDVEEALSGQALPAEVDPGAYPRRVGVHPLPPAGTLPHPGGGDLRSR